MGSAPDPMHDGVPPARHALSPTEREVQAVILLCEGWSERAIALELGISRSSVRSRLEGARRKLLAALEEAE